jgi:hypothetical protein
LVAVSGRLFTGGGIVIELLLQVCIRPAVYRRTSVHPGRSAAMVPFKLKQSKWLHTSCERLITPGGEEPVSEQSRGEPVDPRASARRGAGARGQVLARGSDKPRMVPNPDHEVGIGGAGRTRLALEVAERAGSRLPDGG